MDLQDYKIYSLVLCSLGLTSQSEKNGIFLVICNARLDDWHNNEQHAENFVGPTLNTGSNPAHTLEIYLTNNKMAEIVQCLVLMPMWSENYILGLDGQRL